MFVIHRRIHQALIALLVVTGACAQAQERICPDGKRSYFGVCPDDGNNSRPVPVPTPAPSVVTTPVKPKPSLPPPSAALAASSFVVPFAPGGPTDALVRVLAQGLGASAVVENKPGSSGIPALQSFIQSPRDGVSYYVLTAATLTALQLSNQTALVQQVEPVALLGIQSYVLVIPESAGVRNWADLAQSAKSKRLLAGTSGDGSLSELCMQQIGRATRFNIDLVTYKGVAPLLMDLADGRFDMACVPASGLSNPALKARLTPIAVTLQDTPSLFPGTPTFVNLGVAGVMLGDWVALVRHPRGDAVATNTVTGEIRKVLSRSDFEKRAAQLFFYSFSTESANPTAVKEFVTRQIR